MPFTRRAQPLPTAVARGLVSPTIAGRRFIAGACAASISLASLAGPLIGSAAAQTSVLQQAQGTPPATARSAGSASASNASPATLNPKADFNAPGVDKGEKLIAWAKAGAMVLGTLGLVAGSVVGKLMRQVGNHHAEGVRATALGVGGSMVLVGAAATIVTWLANA